MSIQKHTVGVDLDLDLLIKINICENLRTSKIDGQDKEMEMKFQNGDISRGKVKHTSASIYQNNQGYCQHQAIINGLVLITESIQTPDGRFTNEWYDTLQHCYGPTVSGQRITYLFIVGL